MKPNTLLLFALILCLLSCSKKKPKQQKKIENPLYNKAFDFKDQGKVDSAYVYFIRAKDLFLLYKDSLGVAKCLSNMGFISTNKGDYTGGQESSLNAISYFDENNKKQFAYINSNYGNLGNASFKLGEFENAFRFYDLAIKFSTTSLATINDLNNKANIYRQLNKYDEALKIYSQILDEPLKNQKAYARTLTNISTTKWLQNPSYNPIPNLLIALQIREREKDVPGQNSSYSHLKDYYSTTQPDSALFYARKMYRVAKIINIPDDKLAALQTLIKFSQPKETKQYFETYLSLSDSVQIANDADKNQFAIFRFDLEKSKSDNLKLQKDNTEKKYQIIKREMLLYSVIFVLFAGAIIATLWYRKRKQRLDLEAENTIRENQLKTSKKVHDVVANGLYRAMAEIENEKQIDREAILDKLDHMYQKSRDISYEVEETKPTPQGFQNKITRLLQSFNTPSTKIVIKGNTAALWAKVNLQARHELEHILQELLVNMKKHSGANHVELKFEIKNGEMQIIYDDNGIGFPEEIHFKNGLTNTGNRIENIHGKIIFDNNTNKGLKIQLSFPVLN